MAMTSSNEGAPRPFDRQRYDPRAQDRSVVSIALLDKMAAEQNEPTIAVVIDVNLDFPDGRVMATMLARDIIDVAVGNVGSPNVEQGAAEPSQGGQYLLARLEPAVIREVARKNLEVGAPVHPIHRIWPDFDVFALLDKSVSTVKADALHAAFAGFGKDICWAVLDTGIDANHPHFAAYKNVLSSPVPHRDFTGRGGEITDNNGHGTHVAGIIAGSNKAPEGGTLSAVRFERDEQGNVKQQFVPLPQISGVAPQCSIVSYKVLDDSGIGRTGDILTALDAIQQVNDNGRRLKIHGINLSLGYDFDPKWFACGQSPLCVEIDRMVRSGVVVVVAAGNSGYAYGTDAASLQAVAAGRPLTINDPGNAALAITVGATHRDMPHVYGVSYFSSKGPTGDGRAKPDLVAPGERILSAATGKMRVAAGAPVPPATSVDYVEDSGTSMAAPHVSGVIAAFLSIRHEYIGQPDQVKQIFTSTATDLGRVRDFQGHGLIDAMRAIQSV
jgi:subtilisin family serine protease